MMVPAPTSSVTAPRRAPWGCSGCNTRWTSLTQAHCVKCHRQFASVGVSDKHDRGGVCQHPETVRTKAGKRVYRLVEGADGPVWRSYEQRPTDI